MVNSENRITRRMYGSKRDAKCEICDPGFVTRELCPLASGSLWNMEDNRFIVSAHHGGAFAGVQQV